MKHQGEHRYWAYILANAPRNFYVGFTGRLKQRVYEHKTKSVDCVTNNWHECRLVYYEAWQDVHRAIGREKQIKPWRREKKIRLIESVNPNWHDLSDGWYPDSTRKRTRNPKAMPLHLQKAPLGRGDNRG